MSVSRWSIGAVVLSALLGAAWTLGEGAGSTRVIIVRHAEKEAVPGDDDPISKALGEPRAASLAEVARDAGISAIYATQWVRTQQTAAPLAAATHVPVTVVERSSDAAASATELAARILKDHRGEVVLVVGHSDTVPALVLALGAPAVEPIPETEFDRLYIVDVPAEAGGALLIRARYGAASPRRRRRPGRVQGRSRAAATARRCAGRC